MAENRRDLPVPVKVTLTRPGGVRTTEYAINLSAGGACLQVRDPLEPGRRVGVEFELPTGGEPVRLEARVVWCTEEEEGGDRTRFREVGIRFEDTPRAALQRLAEFTAQAVDSRR